MADLQAIIGACYMAIVVASLIGVRLSAGGKAHD